MSTEVTPESLHTHAEWLDDRNVSVEIYKVRKAAAVEMHRAADCLEHQQRPLPEKPGWYELIVVERGGESCTGAFRDTSGYWHTPDFTVNGASPDVTIRWAEQSGKTPGQTMRDVYLRHQNEGECGSGWWDAAAAAVLAAHDTPTLTPVGEHPESGTRGLLPVVVLDNGGWETPDGWVVHCPVPTVLADPRPHGAS